MHIFKKLLGAKSPPKDPLRRSREKLLSFMRPALSLVDPRDLTIPEKRTRLARFVYGAAVALAKQHGLDQTQTLAVVVQYLGTLNGLHERDISHLVGQCIDLDAQPDSESQAAEQGAEAMSEWLNGDAGKAVQQLAKSLSHRD